MRYVRILLYDSWLCWMDCFATLAKTDVDCLREERSADAIQRILTRAEQGFSPSWAREFEKTYEVEENF